MKKQDRIEFRAFCRNATDNQLRNILAKERLARCMDYAAIAQEEIARRGLKNNS